MSEFHFLRPLWLLLLPFVALLWLRVGRRDAAMGGWANTVDPELLKFLYRGSAQSVARNAQPWLAAAFWVIACLALAGPTWDRQNVALKRDRAALVAVLDLSPSMLAADIKPNRLERARFKLKDLFTRYAGGSSGLVVFGARAYPVAPLTEDANTLINLIDVLSPQIMPAAGARADLGIEQAVELIQRAALKRGEIVVLTDGVNARATAAAARAREAGIHVSVLSVGTAAGAPVALAEGGFVTDQRGGMALAKVDEAALAALAAAGGGRFARLSVDDTDLRALALDAGAKDDSALSEASASISQWHDRGPYLVLLLLPLAALGFRRGVVFVLPLMLLVAPPRAEAFSFRDLWLRPDQQAARALAEGDAKAAAELAQDPDLKGTALYRGGDFARAAERFSSAYNRGTALAKAGALSDAKTALEQALAADPKDADAQHNLDAVNRALEKQQQQQQQQNKDGDKNDSSEQKQQQQDQQDQQQQDEKKPEQQQDAQDGKSQDQSQSASEDKEQKQPAEQQKPDDKKPEDATQQPAKPEPSEQEKAEAEKREAKPERPEDRLAPEERQALEQWLNRVPDDPAGLIRQQLYRKAQAEGAPDDLAEDEQW